MTESCSSKDTNSKRHAWTCQNCRNTGLALANLLTSDETLAGVGELLINSVCPLSTDAECEESLPGFWGAIARMILPEHGEENVCDMETCQDGVTDVGIHRELDINLLIPGYFRCSPPSVGSVSTGSMLPPTCWGGQTL